LKPAARDDRRPRDAMALVSSGRLPAPAASPAASACRRPAES